MPLERYKEKRRFADTPEPSGADIPPDVDSLRFVVQKHRASHLHYDFRLEMDGVLKSWAVPKGPSMNPKDKRLAMMVEDHPLDYRTFEGVIPSGNYGAGTVMVWDQGTYRPQPGGGDREEDDRAMRYGLQKGHLAFVLEGRKLRGAFDLVKLHRGEENAWLLIKKDDGDAADADVREEDRSAASGRTMDEIATGAEAAGEVWISNRATTAIDLGDYPAAPMPHDVRPMLAAETPTPFDRPGWIFEMKWDGYRAIAEIAGGGVRLYSRSGQPFEERFAPIAQSLRRLGRDAVLDGEVVALDGDGKPRFQLLQQSASGEGTLTYCVFDLLWLDGHDLRQAPLCRRKAILKQILPRLPHILLGDHIEGQGVAFFQAVAAQGLEGIIAKEGAGPYLEGRRSGSWLKVKALMEQDAVIGGFTAPRGSRKGLGALVLGVHQGDKFVYIGHAGTGLNDACLGELTRRLQPLIRPTSAFDDPPRTNAPVTWVEPKLVCTVSFKEWTEGGHMRLPVFVRLRDDKPAAEVEPEAQEQAPDEQRRRFHLYRREDTELEIESHSVKLTNAQKVYWPRDGYTKRDLVDYYRHMAPLILPYLRDRPESLHRHPDGIDGESFFQKDVGYELPHWIQTVEIRSEHQDREVNYLICQDEGTLVAMANMGCIELNPWNSRIGTLDRPDYLVIDLDPEAISFQRVVESALAVRAVLEEGGIESYPKTSGATGLHIYIPLGGRYTYDQTRQFAFLIAQLAHRRIPQWTSLERSPAQRQGKVYLDYLQNRRGQTLAAPYSVRPRPSAPVSTPLRWEEVTPKLDPTAFTMTTILNRVEKNGDLWKPVLGPGIDMVQFIDNLSTTIPTSA